MPNVLYRTFSPKTLPLMTRPSYWRELQTAMTYPVAISMVEGSVIGILARRVFNVEPYVFALIMAAPMLAHFTSFFWSRLARGKSKIKAITLVRLLMIACLIGIAFLPTTDAGGVILTILILIIRCCLAGITTLLSTVKRQNYRRNVRARITGKTMLVVSSIMATAPVICYSLLDKDPAMFRYIYLLSVLFALVGTWFFSKIRIRGERDLLRYENMPTSKPTPQGSPAPLYEYNPDDAQTTFWQVLREDKFFRSYQVHQFFLGSGNIMTATMLVFIIEEMTRDMDKGYMWSMVIGTSIPFVVGTMCIQFWARFLDNTHIAKFRVYHTMVFATNIFMVFWAVKFGLLWLLAVSQLVRGVANGGAMLAWQLGHNDFADRRQVMTYIGVHATLTGVRGATAPFIGMLLFEGWGESSFSWMPSFEGIGPYTFLVALAMQAVALFGFFRLYRRMQTANRV
ncbi:MAG TPA: hypothetical protein DCM28_21905 [Phycisphaerales bacterium]|nr:hypothetical protein [Phycisphaerales bacterium]|tara:strand:+ start:1136 stop:2500 length:1365 start_codon:yes stop_codon:yes gene_type:complete